MNEQQIREAMYQAGLQQLRRQRALLTADQLIREALDAFVNEESPIDLRDWVNSARAHLEASR